MVGQEDSDLQVVDLALNAGAALDTACSHAQQAAERLLKGYLSAYDIDFPFTHNLARLLVLCQARDPAFSSLATLAELLTPYAVDLRCDNRFWPSVEVAREARDAALTIKDFVIQRLPPDFVAAGEG